MKKSAITSHILDTAQGVPVTGLNVRLFVYTNDEYQLVAQGISDDDGRLIDWIDEDVSINKGLYKIIFETEAYLLKTADVAFYPVVEVCFQVISDEHHHIPLLLSPFGYSTYRGS